MPFKEKAIVRHKLRPDWGAGRVLVRTEEYLQIDFTAGGLKKLKTSIADDHLEAATAEEAKALKPEKVKAVKAVKADKADKVEKADKVKDVAKRVVTPKTRMA